MKKSLSSKCVRILPFFLEKISSPVLVLFAQYDAYSFPFKMSTLEYCTWYRHVKLKFIAKLNHFYNWRYKLTITKIYFNGFVILLSILSYPIRQKQFDIYNLCPYLTGLDIKYESKLIFNTAKFYRYTYDTYL